MRLKQLRLSNYRNYRQVELETNHQVNIFVGPNAQGKTNLLEAILVLSLTKSHRTHKDKELIRWEAPEAFIFGEVQKKYGDASLSLQIGQQGKKAKINGLEQRKLSDFIGTMNVVMFAPEDLEIVKGSPGVRRRFLDMEIGQVSPAYLHDLLQYQKVLQQRNHLLKTGATPNREMLEIWNGQLSSFGVKIMRKRKNFIEKLQTIAMRIHQSITNEQEQIRIEYNPSLPLEDFTDETVLFERFMVKLSQVNEQELRRGMTLFGPHRDDLQFFINDKDALPFGSQGQQRTAALSLKLAEIELIYEEVGEYPILLLDDVLSELDNLRQTQLIRTFGEKVQTFITTTGIESVDWHLLQGARMVHIRDGQLAGGIES
ncbi:MAG TPA: DNA replication/repair protein RecF [Bacilli bacterium]